MSNKLRCFFRQNICRNGYRFVLYIVIILMSSLTLCVYIRILLFFVPKIKPVQLV